MSGLNPNLRATTDQFQQMFTLRQTQTIDKVRMVTPKAFLKNCGEGFTTDIRLLGMFSLALLDYNSAPPGAFYTSSNYPDGIEPLLIYGTEMYILEFMLRKYTLIDISYSDGGLSVNLDRVSKLKVAYDVVNANWLRLLGNAKNVQLMSQGGMGLGTPRFQSNLSRFIGMLGDGAFGWNIP